MSDRKDLVKFIRSLKLRYFKPHEVMVHMDRPLNGIPARGLWVNCVPTLRVLDALRHEVGFPLRITSGHREPAYNRKVGGTPGSTHQVFGADDFQPILQRGDTAAALLSKNRLCRKVLRRWRSEGRLFESGVILPRGWQHRWSIRVRMYPLELWSGGYNDVFRFSGGLGSYPSFTHLDVRGRNFTW